VAKVALLVGVSEYEPGLNPLPAAVKDIDAIQEVFIHPQIGGFAESDITLLKNPERQVMEEAIYTLFAERHRDDLLVLFFSGHGIKNDSGDLYLATRGTRKTLRGELISPTAVAAKFVHECMSRSRSRRQVVVLDSCFSGAFAEGLSAKDDGTINIREQLGGEGRAVLTSSSSTQYSFEEEGQELSLYTRFLIEGIKTGQADQDGDDFISIDELHDYASRKVREVKPESKPEIYAVREGFKIRLAQVSLGDPREKYRKEVARYGKRGDLTVVSRGILDTWRFKLGLSVDEAKALENEALEPYRREFQQKLQRYEQVFAEVLQRDETVNEATRQELQNLQQLLELRNEDIVKIEAKVTARLKTHRHNLEAYEQAFSDTLRQEYPLTESSRERLRQMQQQLELTDSDIAPIKSQITTEVEAYHQNLQQYEQQFALATQQEYPLNQAKRDELQQQQQSLGLTDSDVAPIEAKITAQIETYHQKLQQYEQAFVKATQRKQHPDTVQRSQLQQTWQTLGLSEEDVRTIESQIVTQIETHQNHLQQYDQAFTEATQQQFPLSDAQQAALKQRQQALTLTDEDVVSSQSRITASIEEEQQKRDQYRQVFAEAIQFEYPPSDATRDELRHFQKVLELSNEEMERIEAQVVKQAEVTKEETAQVTEQATGARVGRYLQETLPTLAEPSNSWSERTEAISIDSKGKNAASESITSERSLTSLASSSSQDSLENTRRAGNITLPLKKQSYLALFCMIAVVSIISYGIYSNYSGGEPTKQQQSSVPKNSAPSTSAQASTDPQVIAREKKLPMLKGKATVELVVRKSPITIEVDGANAPITAGNFVDLVNRGVYKGLLFHRVVREPHPRVVQGGDPQGKNPNFPLEELGRGGYIDPATSQPRNVPLEIKPEGAAQILYSKTLEGAKPKLKNTRGAVAMAHSSDLDSASSQFYIALGDLEVLDGSYAVFGYVTRGMNVVDQIQQGDLIESAKVISGLENLQTAK
jgi:cyclophilin family peptidyl-prolyl cis-trans isomerase